MDSLYTLVLENKEDLQILCGHNDENIGILEEELNTSLYLKGNSIILSSDEKLNIDILNALIENIRHNKNSDFQLSRDFIRSLVHSIETGNKDAIELLSHTQITFPSGRRVYPKTSTQAEFIKALMHKEFVFGIGPAGTGKTYLAVAAALEALMSKRKSKLLLTRPVVEAGENLGFLPGDLAQKINPYLRPLYDAMYELAGYEFIQKLESQQIIEVAPLAYMRGRSLKNAIVLLDEAQNTTKEQMKMFLTRIGENSLAYITGDTTQIDLPQKSSSGLIHASKILRSVPEISFTFFKNRDIVRNRIVQKIIDAYEKNEK